MRLKEIKPGMVIHCKNDEEKKALLEEAERLGYLWANGTKPTKAFFPSNTLVFQVNGLKKYISWTGDSEKNTEFSDLILPELTAEKVLKIVNDICQTKSYHERNCSPNCPFYHGIFCRQWMAEHPTETVEICAKWKADHEKKEPEIETVDICRIIEIQPDGCKRCVHEEDISDGELMYSGDAVEKCRYILKNYCKEHDGNFIAAHEVVSRVKAVE